MSPMAKNSSNWSELQSDLLELIMKRLPSIDVLRTKAVCCWWNCVGKTHKWFLPTTPWFMLLDPIDPRCLFFFNMEEKRTYKLCDAIPKELGASYYIVGSSHSRLVVMDERARPHLLNPFNSRHGLIQLPDLKTFPTIVDVDEQSDGSFIVVYSSRDNGYDLYQSIKHLRENFLQKVVVSDDPFYSQNYVVVAIYGRDEANLLAFYASGDDKWSALDGKHQPYRDITWWNNKLCALCHTDTVVEIWDFVKPNLPIKILCIEPEFPPWPDGVSIVKFKIFFGDIFCRNYLVESAGDLLLVCSHVDRINWNDHLWGKRKNSHNHGLISLHDRLSFDAYNKTLDFIVYKLDFDEKRWIKVESLNDRVLFVSEGFAQTLSALDVSCCKGNSIYFADNWNRRIGDYSCGGHHVSVFHYGTQRFKPIYESNLYRIEKYTPFWIVLVP